MILEIEESVLGTAINKNNIEIVKLLIKNGANICAANDYALREAVYHGHLEIVKLLLEKL